MLPDGESWLLRPVLAGVIKAESLVDGTIDLAYVALLNDGLDAKNENEARASKALE